MKNGRQTMYLKHIKNMVAIVFVMYAEIVIMYVNYKLSLVILMLASANQWIPKYFRKKRNINNANNLAKIHIHTLSLSGLFKVFLCVRSVTLT